MDNTRCEKCDINFASKYTFARHLKQKHNNAIWVPFKNNQSEENQDDSMSEASDNTSNHSKTLKDTSNDAEDEEEEEKEEEEEEEDYWAKIIKLTVHDIWFKNMKQYDSGVVCDITDIEQFLQGKNPTRLCNRIREMDKMVNEIQSAAEDDILYTSIKQKLDNELGDYDLEKEEKYKEAFTEQASIVAWKHFKYMIKKKIKENLDLFDILVNKSESDDEPSTSMV